MAMANLSDHGPELVLSLRWEGMVLEYVLSSFQTLLVQRWTRVPLIRVKRLVRGVTEYLRYHRTSVLVSRAGYNLSRVFRPEGIPLLDLCYHHQRKKSEIGLEN